MLDAAARARLAEEVLRGEGMQARVEPEGPDAEIAAIRVSPVSWDRWFGPDGAELAARVRNVGFRYVAVDLDPTSGVGD